MSTRIHRPLKVLAFNANGIGRQRYELSKELQELLVDVAPVFRDTFETSWEIFIPNFQLYRTDR
jgi:hypothetical protein